MASTLRFDNWEDSNGNPIASKNSSFGGFNASVTITATDAAWAVPTLASPIVKVTAIGAGGGGGSGGGNGGTGGTTTFNAGGAGTVTAAGGNGGRRERPDAQNALPANNGFAAGNHGLSANEGASGWGAGGAGGGGKITVAYLDMTGISTVNVTIGAGGSGTGANGGNGEVIVEYVAG